MLPLRITPRTPLLGEVHSLHGSLRLLLIYPEETAEAHETVIREDGGHGLIATHWSDVVRLICACACVCACVRACVCACVRACVRVCVCTDFCPDWLFVAGPTFLSVLLLLTVTMGEIRTVQSTSLGCYKVYELYCN